MPTPPVRLEHARSALAARDACNPAGVLHTAWRIAAEVQRDHGTAAACDYAPLRLLAYKLAEMTGVPVEYGDAYNHAYLACWDNAPQDVTTEADRRR